MEMYPKGCLNDKFDIFSCQNFVNFSCEQGNDKLKFVKQEMCYFRHHKNRILVHKSII